MILDKHFIKYCTYTYLSRDFIELYNIYKHKEDMCMFQ